MTVTSGSGEEQNNFIAVSELSWKRKTLRKMEVNVKSPCFILMCIREAKPWLLISHVKPPPTISFMRLGLSPSEEQGWVSLQEMKIASRLCGCFKGGHNPDSPGYSRRQWLSIQPSQLCSLALLGEEEWEGDVYVCGVEVSHCLWGFLYLCIICCHLFMHLSPSIFVLLSFSLFCI